VTGDVVHGVGLALVLGHEGVHVVDHIVSDGGSHHGREGGLRGGGIRVADIEYRDKRAAHFYLGSC
jgi:hypothetical protein